MKRSLFKNIIALHIDWCVRTFLPDSFFYGDGVKSMVGCLHEDLGESKTLQSAAIGFVMMSSIYMENLGSESIKVSCSNVAHKGVPMQDFEISVVKAFE